jgi:hypothetical protein
MREAEKARGPDEALNRFFGTLVIINGKMDKTGQVG